MERRQQLVGAVIEWQTHSEQGYQAEGRFFFCGWPIAVECHRIEQTSKTHNHPQRQGNGASKGELAYVQPLQPVCHIIKFLISPAAIFLVHSESEEGREKEWGAARPTLNTAEKCLKPLFHPASIECSLSAIILSRSIPVAMQQDQRRRLKRFLSANGHCLLNAAVGQGSMHFQADWKGKGRNLKGN